MPSLLSRLRKRTISSSVSSRSERSTQLPTTPPPESTVLPSISHPPQSPVNRKILENPDAFFDDDGPTESTYRRPIVPAGLIPSPRRPSFGSQGRPSMQVASEIDEPQAGLGSNAMSREIVKSSKRFLNRLSDIASSGEWSTFGRVTEPTSPSLGEFGQQRDDSSRVSSPVTKGRESAGTRSKNVSRQSSVVHASPVSSSPVVKDSSPSGTISSRSRPSQRTNEGARSSHSPTFFAGSRVYGLDSPTFGFLAPSEIHVLAQVPALDQPELTADLSRWRSPADLSRSNDVVGPISSQADLPVRQFESTYPPSRASEISVRAINAGGTTSSLPHVFSKSSRSRRYSSLPKAQQIFIRNSPEGRADTPHTRTSRRSTGSGRNKQDRRISAEWNARQATEEIGWPAMVTKEMLKLSLGEGELLEGASATGPGPRSYDGPRADNVHDSPNLLSSFNHPSPVHPPSPPQSPSLGLISLKGSDLGNHLTGPQSDQPHARFNSTSSGELESENMPVKESSRTDRSTAKPSKGKVAADPSLLDPTSPPASLQIPPSLSFTSPTPEVSPFRSPGSPSPPSDSKNSTALNIPSPVKTPSRKTSDKSRGKRKADDVETTPPDQKKEAQRATFAPTEPRPLRVSDSSHAPSSYQNKRARISEPLPTPSPSRPGSATAQSHTHGSWSSRASSRIFPQQAPPRTPSRAASTRSANHQPQSTSHSHQPYQQHAHRASSDRRTSISGMSIPISALVSPHAPSVSRSTKFHMQDPRKPPRKRDTGWGLRFKGVDEPGSPIQAWFFFIGFVIFPLWWVASVLRTPKTRHVGGSDTEKAVTIDDPQVERDAKVWRLRCRIMSIVSVLTYIPFIVLVAIFAPR